MGKSTACRWSRHLDAALAYEPELVVDLSDEPVLPPERRLELASRSLALGLRYLGPDFDFEPPRYEPFSLPSLAVIGTGKRIGKTALTGQLARVLSRDRDSSSSRWAAAAPPSRS